MELTERERQKVAAVLLAYSLDWDAIAQKSPGGMIPIDRMAGYLTEEAALTLAHDNDVLGDRG